MEEARGRRGAGARLDLEAERGASYAERGRVGELSFFQEKERESVRERERGRLGCCASPLVWRRGGFFPCFLSLSPFVFSFLSKLAFAVSIPGGGSQSEHHREGRSEDGKRAGHFFFFRVQRGRKFRGFFRFRARKMRTRQKRRGNPFFFVARSRSPSLVLTLPPPGPSRFLINPQFCIPFASRFAFFQLQERIRFVFSLMQTTPLPLDFFLSLPLSLPSLLSLSLPLLSLPFPHIRITAFE